MCLDTVGRVVGTHGGVAQVAFEDAQRSISLVLLDAEGIAVQPGDWLLTHTGLAVERLAPAAAEEMVAQARAVRESEVES